MNFATKSLQLLFGLSVCSIGGYLIYLMLKNDDDEEYLDPVIKTSKYRIHEIKVPKDLVRSLIGRSGQNIKLIQEQSNTRIHFKDREDSECRFCIIRGSEEGCNVADNLIQEFIHNQPLIESQVYSVPQNCVSKIIGRCGERIHELQSQSGAKINIETDKNLPTRRITIKGTKEQIVVAWSLIEDIVGYTREIENAIEATISKREPRLPRKAESPKEIPSPKVERISACQADGPDSQFEVYVSAMLDPSRFWLQIVGPKAKELDCLVEEMTEYYNKPENRLLHQPDTVSTGDLVAASFHIDNKWYRAEVLKVNDANEAELYYVDYGDTDLIPCNQVFELRTDFLRLHFQAIECFLARVEPTDGESWSADAVDKFEEWTHVAQWQKLSAKINGYAVREKTRAKREGSPVPGVDLYDVNDEQDMDIAEELVKQGLAVFKKNQQLSSRATSISNISVASSS